MLAPLVMAAPGRWAAREGTVAAAPVMGASSVASAMAGPAGAVAVTPASLAAVAVMPASLAVVAATLACPVV